MIFKISWRNVWRQTTRSLIVISAIAVGVWAGVFILGFYHGIINQRVNDVIQTEVSHIQIHHPDYKGSFHPRYQISNSREVLGSLNMDERIIQASGRNISMVMIASANASTGLKLVGINTEQERKVTVIHERITDGNYALETPNSIIISRKLSEKLNLKVGSKLVVTLQTKNNDLVADAFRVSGIFKTSSAKYDESTAFIRADKLQELLNVQDYHEIAILLDDHEGVDSVTADLSEQLNHLSIENWKDLSPGMRYMVETSDRSLGIVMWIILLALVFGIVNTMLMAVLERIREIGMLVAIGMSKIRVFTMIVVETIMLVFVGAPFGLLLGFAFVTYFGNQGIDLSILSEALEEFGYASMVYPTLEGMEYIKVSLQLVLLAIVSSIFPAWRALKLKVIDAIRKI